MSNEVRKRSDGGKGKDEDTKTGNMKGIKEQRKASKKEEEDPPPKFGPMPGVSKHRLFSRAALILGVMTIVWFNSRNKDVSFAEFNETVKGKFYERKCSAAYNSAVSKFKGCVPKTCGRYVTDEVLNLQDQYALREMSNRYLKDIPNGISSAVVDLQSKTLKYGGTFKSLKDQVRKSDPMVLKAVSEKIRQLVSKQFKIDQLKLSLTYPAFISLMKPVTKSHSAKNAQEVSDSYWHITAHQRHHGHYHYSAIVFLSNQDEDHGSGRFVFFDHSDHTNHTVDPKQGRVLAFTSGSENTHFHETISSGSKIGITFGFTCDSSKAIKID